jgi:hypothetical protein
LGRLAAVASKLWSPDNRRVLGFFVAVGALGVAAFWMREPPPVAVGSTCSLRTWNLRQRPIRLVLETGGVIHVPNPSPCVVIDDGKERTLVRVTEGPYKGVSGWVSRSSVGR